MNIFICKICKQKCKSNIGLSTHLNCKHKLNTKKYYDQFFKQINEDKCLICSKLTNFRTLSRGYHQYCSRVCSKECNKGEKVIRIFRKCKTCKKKMRVKIISNSVFCRIKCKTLFSRGKQVPKNVREKISRALKGRVFSEEHRKKMSESGKGRKFSKEHIRKLRESRRVYKDTKIELALQEVLKKLKIKFRTQELILGRPDIFIEPNLCLFADGNYWHNLLGRREYDANIGRQLRKKGYSVLRFWEKDINKNINKCADKIERHINRYKEYYLSSLGDK